MTRRVTALAISGMACSGKTTLANALSARLSWDHVNSGAILRDLSRSAGLRIEGFGGLDDTTLKRIDEEILQRMRSESHKVWEGRLAIWLARNLNDVLKVYVDANPEIRIDRCQNREHIDREDARRLLFAREHEERDVFGRLYGFTDIKNNSNIDLDLDSSRSTPEELVERVIQTMK